MSLGLGVALMVAVMLIDGNLRHQVDESLPKQAPAFFFVDIQNHQAEPFDRIVKGIKGVGELKRSPSLRGRIVKINGIDVEKGHHCFQCGMGGARRPCAYLRKRTAGRGGHNSRKLVADRLSGQAENFP